MFVDIMGIEIFEDYDDFGWCMKFVYGLIFVNVVFVDEINCILLKI